MTASRNLSLLKPWVIILGVVVITILAGIFVFLNKNNELTGIEIKTISTNSGETIVSYQDVNGIYVQKIDLSGRSVWGDDSYVTIHQKSDQGYSICPDGLGGVIILVYNSDTSNRYLTWPEALKPSSVIAQRLGINGEELWADGISPGTTKPGSALIVSDGSDGSIIAWNEYIPSRQPDEPILRVNKLDSDGNLLWGNRGVTIAESNGREFPLYNGKFEIVGDGEQGVYVFWEISSGSNEYLTYAQRLDSHGSTIWPENIVIVKNKLMTAESDGSGGALVKSVEITGAFVNPSVFTQISKTGDIIAEYVSLTGGTLLKDGFDGYFEIAENYFAPSGVSMSEADVTLDVQHLDGEGNVIWSRIAVADPGKGNRINYDYFIDGIGGLYLVWQKIEKNNSNSGEILISHFSRDAIAHQDLESNGKGYSVFGTNKMNMIAAFTDGEGGAIIIAHTLAGIFKKNMIYIQRINLEGTKLWEQRIIIHK